MLASAREILPDVIAIRRRLHRIPEVGLELPISATAVATLVANLFQGLEVEILAGVSEDEAPHLEVLEAVAQLIERIEADASR